MAKKIEYVLQYKKGYIPNTSKPKISDEPPAISWEEWVEIVAGLFLGFACCLGGLFFLGYCIWDWLVR